MIKKLFIIIVILAAGWFFFVEVFLPTHTDVEILFQGIIADPIPKEVTNLSGASITFGGYDVYLCFNATDAFISQLIKNHEKVSYESNKEYFKKNIALIHKLGFWKVDRVKNSECYRSTKRYKNEFTHEGEDWILIDRITNTVYYHGGGA